MALIETNDYKKKKIQNVITTSPFYSTSNCFVFAGLLRRRDTWKQEQIKRGLATAPAVIVSHPPNQRGLTRSNRSTSFTSVCQIFRRSLFHQDQIDSCQPDSKGWRGGEESARRLMFEKVSRCWHGFERSRATFRDLFANSHYGKSDGGIVLVILKLNFQFPTKVYGRLQLQSCQLVYRLTVNNYQH